MTLRQHALAVSLFTVVTYFPPSYLLLDISRATFILLAVTDTAIAYKSGIVLFLPELPVDELLHQRARQGRRKHVDENDRLHKQNLPHFWAWGLILTGTSTGTAPRRPLSAAPHRAEVTQCRRCVTPTAGTRMTAASLSGGVSPVSPAPCHRPPRPPRGRGWAPPSRRGAP